MSGTKRRQSTARFFSLHVFSKATVVLKHKVSKGQHYEIQVIEFQLNIPERKRQKYSYSIHKSLVMSKKHHI